MKTSIKTKVLFVLSLLFGLLFINGGLDKFFHYMPMPKDISENMQKAFGAFMEISWLMPLVGFVELLGGILFIIPKTRALGAIVIFPVMIGILLTNTITDSTGLPIALVLLAINLWVIYENRNKYLPMIK
jgi:uncharacterized membrane protein YphA (DoxX/SURF4 family)